MRPKVEKDSVPGDGAYPTVVEPYLQSFRGGEFCLAHHEFSASVLIFLEMIGYQSFDHLAFPVPHRCHVAWGRIGVHTELIGVMKEVRNLCAPDLVLRGKAIDVRAGAADPPPLNPNDR
jgi:hypothetical protein